MNNSATQTQIPAINHTVDESAASDNPQLWNVAFDYLRKIAEYWEVFMMVFAILGVVTIIPRAMWWWRNCDRSRFANEMEEARVEHPIAEYLYNRLNLSARGFRGSLEDPADNAALPAELTLLLSLGVDSCAALDFGNVQQVAEDAYETFVLRGLPKRSCCGICGPSAAAKRATIGGLCWYALL